MGASTSSLTREIVRLDIPEIKHGSLIRRGHLRHQPQRLALALYEVNSPSLGSNNSSHGAPAKTAIVCVDLVRIILVGH